MKKILITLALIAPCIAGAVTAEDIKGKWCIDRTVGRFEVSIGSNGSYHEVFRHDNFYIDPMDGQWSFKGESTLQVHGFWALEENLHTPDGFNDVFNIQLIDEDTLLLERPEESMNLIPINHPSRTKVYELKRCQPEAGLFS